MNSIVEKNSQNVKGERIWGENISPLEGADNICRELPWDSDGFTIEPFLDEETYRNFELETHQLLLDTLKTVGIHVSDNFNFEEYHKVIGNRHLEFVERIKHIPSSQFPINRKIMDQRVSEICRQDMCNFNPLTKDRVYHFRVIRPHQYDHKIFFDNNPVHRDTWHWEYQNNINIYVGLYGSTKDSSLPLAPGSHHWNESEIERTKGGALINRTQYVVPAVTDSKREFEMIRPNPGRNEILVFSPYLLHGGAINYNDDKTRISLEMRFWRNNVSC